MSSYLDTDFRPTPSGTLSETIEEQKDLVDALEKQDAEYVQDLEKQSAEILGATENDIGDQQIQFDAPPNIFDPNQEAGPSFSQGQDTSITGQEAPSDIGSGIFGQEEEDSVFPIPDEPLGFTEPPADQPAFGEVDLGLGLEQPESGIERSPWDPKFLDINVQQFP